MQWRSNILVVFVSLMLLSGRVGRGGMGGAVVGVGAESLSNFPPTIHRCVWASNKLRKSGDGSTPTSCFGCNPAQKACSVGCQDLIDTVYQVCANVTLPDGYFFDPLFQLDGGWDTNLDAMKINVEKCGCNSASLGTPLSALTLALALLVAVGLALG